MIECLLCKTPFAPKRLDQKYCSTECRLKNANNNYHLGLHNRYKKSCCYCAGFFLTSYPKQKCCSIACSSKYNNRHIYYNGLKRCSDCYEYKQESDYKICSDGKGGKKMRSYCKDCTRSRDMLRNAKRRNSTLIYDHVDYVEVFNLYSWKCNNCGVNTPKELRGLHLPNSPELDHIMPISKGGSHDYHNVQLLCRKCNLKKGNKYAESAIRTNGLSYQAGQDIVL